MNQHSISLSKSPLVSICIPVYNGEKYIQEAVKSVLHQTYQNLEVVICDNQSTDQTWAILQGLAERDSRIKIYRNEKNLGMTGNWNRIMSLARGEYKMLLSADDMIKPTLIAVALDTFQQHPSTDLVTFEFELLDCQGAEQVIKHRKVCIPQGLCQNFPLLVLHKNPFNINFTVFSQRALDRLKTDNVIFPHNLLTSDYDLWFRCAELQLKVFYHGDHLGIYRRHLNNLSLHRKEMTRDTFLTLRHHQKTMVKVSLFRFFYILHKLRRIYYKQIHERSMPPDKRLAKLLRYRFMVSRVVIPTLLSRMTGWILRRDKCSNTL